MDAVLLARIQFALTAGFHFVFPAITIGLAWLIVVLMTRYRRSGRAADREAARFWIRILGITFAVGVATGIVLEFEFGTNWSEYSRFVGDIFGAPLAAEGISSFFLESVFIAVLLFGWQRASVKVLWFAALMVAIGATLSGFWIIVANSWQQTPAGYHIVGGRAELTDFWAAVFNPSTIPRYLHTIIASLVSGAFFMMGLAALLVRRGRRIDLARRSLRLSLVVGLVAAIALIFSGHGHAVQVAETQPEKLAAIEGLFETQARAPALVFGIPDGERETVHARVEIPAALSLLAFGDADAEVQGLKAFPRDAWPPLGLTFYPFHLMVYLSGFFVLFTTWGLWRWRRGVLERPSAFLRIAPWAIPLPIIACELGWITAEVGRQPWIVYRLLRTSEGVSVNVPPGQILASILIFSAIYLVLLVAWIFLLRRELHREPAVAAGGDPATSDAPGGERFGSRASGGATPAGKGGAA
ncbi:MAG: cytochrome ubiquinol oxidase subunit I [Candidatus Eisenbacteria bacterium]|nr:cytochrome ubiquinol oxidase subunit I [Candidatus Eisenbacteria bacterium]